MTTPAVHDARPVAFISYAWSSTPHKLWVRQLADDLVANNIEVIFDDYELKPGHDTYAYMERMVTDDRVQKVLCVSDRLYAEKADGREGGVGTETQIITPQLYEKTNQTKFVPLVRELDEQGKAYLPVFLKGRYYIDFSNDDDYDAKLDELLRDIYSKPKRPKPPFGPPPAFLGEDEVTLTTAGMARRIERALREGSPTARGLFEKYGDTFMATMPEHRLTPEEAQKENMDDQIWSSIHKLRTYRDDFLEVLDAFALYARDERWIESVHKFIERSLEWTKPPTGQGYNQLWYDNHRFLRRDIFLCSVALLLRRDRPELAAYLLREGYLDTSQGRAEMVPFGGFDQPMASLDERRNRRLQRNRQSVVADLVKELTPVRYFTFEFLCEVDFLLWVRSVIDSKEEGYQESWYPRTSPFLQRGLELELFLRAQAPKGLGTLLTFLGVKSKAEFIAKLTAGAKKLDRSAEGWTKIILRAVDSWAEA